MQHYPCPQCGQLVDLAVGVCPYDGHDLRREPASGSTSVPVAIEALGGLPPVAPSDTEPDAVAPVAHDGTGPFTDPEDPHIGLTLGRYVIERRIGKGGWGSVYQARHQGLGQLVAVKLLTGLSRMEKASVARLIAEGRAAAKIGHSNIVKIFDDGFHAHVGPYIVMEMLQGKSLEELLKKGRLEERRACTLALQIADALAAAHEHRIVHRDVKPANVFLEVHAAGEIAKVLDFGIAKFDGIQEGTPTELGAILGTPRYMSPEQWNGAKVDVRSDVYSFGIVLYQMLTGALPYPTANTLLQLAGHVQAEISPRAEDLVPELDPRLAELIRDCTVVDHEKRARTMREAVAILRSVLATSAHTRVGAEPAASRVTAPEPSSRVSERPRWPLFAGAVLLTILLGLVAHQTITPRPMHVTLRAGTFPRVVFPVRPEQPREIPVSSLPRAPDSVVGSQKVSHAALSSRPLRAGKPPPKDDTRSLLYSDGDPLVHH